MNTAIFDKMPCGASWWNIRHPSAADWMQNPYGDSESVMPSKVIKQNNSNTSASLVPKFSFIRDEQDRRNIMEQSEKQKSRCRQTVIEATLEAIDPCASLYTHSQRMDALEVVRTRLLQFVSGSVYAHLGPKKSRILSAWLSGNRIDPCNAALIQEFMNFLLEEKAADWIVTPSPHGKWYCERLAKPSSQ